MMNTFKIIIFCISILFMQAQTFANNKDPFTRSLGGEPLAQTNKDVSEKIPNKDNKPSTNTDMAANTEVTPSPTTNSVSPVGAIGNVLTPEPLSSYDLDKYILKGTALSTSRRLKTVVFDRQANTKQIDYGNIPTTHRVRQNDTVESIATRYGYSSEEIKIANAIVPGSKLILGTQVVLPARIHTVRKQQNLTMIADLYKIDVRDLAGFNNLSANDELKVNEKLLLPFYVYKTTKIQTIKDIANQFNRTANEVLKINNLSRGDVLDKGQYIKIPIRVTPFENQQIVDEDKRSLITYVINPKNLAILEVNGQQFMVREGDSLGKNKGRIVKITSKDMKILENYEEFIFQINTPINQQVTYAPATQVPVTPISDVAVPGTGTDGTAAPSTGTPPTPAGTANTDASVTSPSSTNVEDLFK